MTAICAVHNWSNEMLFSLSLLAEEERYYMLSRPLVKQTFCMKKYVVALKFMLFKNAMLHMLPVLCLLNTFVENNNF